MKKLLMILLAFVALYIPTKAFGADNMGTPVR